MGFDILVFGMSSWDDLLKFNTRSKNVVLELEKRSDIDKILHVDLFGVVEVPQLRRRKIPYTIKQYSPKLFVLRFAEPLAVLSGSTELPSGFCKAVRVASEQLGLRNVILWLYNPVAAGCLTKLNALVRVFDGVDNWLGHKTFVEQFGRSRIAHGYAAIQKRADAVFVVAERLLDLFPDRSDVRVLRNAVDVGQLQRIAEECQEPPPDIRQVNRPIVGFSGGIQHRIDFTLLRYLAESNPEVSFVLVGPVWHEVKPKVQDLEAMQNVYFLGEKRYSKLPCYIKYFDVCIIPHVSDELEKSGGYSMKALDYLALGKPVVSSTSVGLEDLGNFINLAADPEEFDRKLKELLERKPASLEFPEFLRDRTWENTIDKMMKRAISKITWARLMRARVHQLRSKLVSPIVRILGFLYRGSRRVMRLLKERLEV